MGCFLCGISFFLSLVCNIVFIIAFLVNLLLSGWSFQLGSILTCLTPGEFTQLGAQWLPIYTMAAPRSLAALPVGSQLRPRMADDSPALSSPFSTRQSFFQRNGANVQPRRQLTQKPGPYANFMMAETVVFPACCRNDVVWRCTYSNPDFYWIIDNQQGQGLLLVLPCGAVWGLTLHLHS